MKDFLGKGIGFPLEVDGYGRLRLSSHERSVEESIRMILGTAVGERVMQPDFGCRIHDFVFHPADPNTSASIMLAVMNALRKWEPRVDDVEVLLGDNRDLLEIMGHRKRPNSTASRVQDDGLPELVSAGPG